MLECSLWHTTCSRDKVALARDGFTERAQNGQRVLVESSMGDVLTEKGGEMRAMIVQLSG